jgi:AcrR family transcriptional regulator
MTDALRERILDAAYELTSSRGWSAVTMAGLGQTVGVSRQSVYNEFGSKEQVADALVAREVSAFLGAVQVQMSRGETPAQSVTLAADAVFAMAAENPLLHSMLTAAAGADSPVLPLLTSQAQPVIDVAVALITEALRTRFDDLLPANELRIAVESVVRVVLSHVVQPGRSDAADIAFVADRLLASKPR